MDLIEQTLDSQPALRFGSTRASRGESPRISVHTERIVDLDGLRGVAIGMVFLFHYTGWIATQWSPPKLSTLFQVFSFGWTGVDLFFVLSGFLITSILLNERHAQLFPELLCTSGVAHLARLLRLPDSDILLLLACTGRTPGFPGLIPIKGLVLGVYAELAGRVFPEICTQSRFSYPLLVACSRRAILSGLAFARLSAQPPAAG